MVESSSTSIKARFLDLRTSALHGRIRARLPRYAFLSFVALMCLAGVRSILLPAVPDAAPIAAAPASDLAEQSYALAFSHAYLSYEGAHQEAREVALEPFASSGLELGAGFSPPRAGSQSVQWADVAQVQRPLVGGVIITIAAKLSTEQQPVYLSVPIDRDHSGAIYLAGYPSFVGPPLSTARGETDIGGEPVADSEVSALVKRALANYLAGDAENLSADLADAATVTLPTNQLRLEGVDRLDWVSGNGGGAVLATVSATDGLGGTYTLRYEVGLRHVSSSDPALGPGWRVTYVQTISQRS
jgi:hypothetical protein